MNWKKLFMNKKNQKTTPAVKAGKKNPEGWREVELGDSDYFLILSSGIDKFDSVKNYLSTSSVEINRIVSVESRITFDDRPSRANMQPVVNSVWFAKMNDTVKVLEITDQDFADNYILSTGFAGIGCGKNVNSGFLKQILLSDSFNNEKNNRSKGTTQKAINNEELKKIKILLPPLSVQNKIAEILGAVDEEIEKTEGVIADTEKLKEGLLKNFFKSTQKVLLDTVAKRGSGHTPNKQHPEYWDDGIKWVSLADSGKLDNRFIYKTDKEISLQGIDHSSAVLYKKNTVIVCRDASIGRVAILGADNMAVSQHFIAWQCGEKLSFKYLYYWLQSQKNILERVATGTTIKTIGLPFFKKILIPILNVQEQEKIGDIFWDIDNKISIYKKIKNNLIRLKKGLMADLLSGKKNI